MPERQAAKLPDAGAPATTSQSNQWRKAMIAGLVTSPQGVLGSPTVSKPVLG